MFWKRNKWLTKGSCKREQKKECARRRKKNCAPLLYKIRLLFKERLYRSKNTSLYVYVSVLTSESDYKKRSHSIARDSPEGIMEAATHPARHTSSIVIIIWGVRIFRTLFVHTTTQYSHTIIRVWQWSIHPGAVSLFAPDAFKFAFPASPPSFSPAQTRRSYESESIFAATPPLPFASGRWMRDATFGESHLCSEELIFHFRKRAEWKKKKLKSRKQGTNQFAYFS